MIKPGIYPHLSNEDYHADKNSLSRSSIRDFHRNPYYYHSMHLNPNRPAKKSTPEMILGSAFHTMVLEPDNFEKEYIIEPEKVLLKNTDRKTYDDYKAKCEALEKSKLTVLTPEELVTLNSMAHALERDPRIYKLLNGGDIEKSFFWNDPGSGLLIKARPDIIHDNMIVDLKTIADASPRAFQSSMADGWYHVQGAMIRDAVRRLENRDISTVINVCVEKKYPYCVGIYIIDEEALNVGEAKYKEILLNMKSCIINKKFKDYEVSTIGLPAWYK
jgi:exodeoxyribonuclease VIII